ncbi:hypothetical protein [Lignipirellula cremea]|uniref:Uncharacterized protein n=1 Tax=Lignipirellula cremea TaxID=2528010 RepID=A0A518DPG6_9BACT|nr:hypothetical protein [Lignipirellula cremea]QDU93740.1 hypothetical protein Pla8534_15230 [Lignipirellula cremea]
MANSKLRIYYGPEDEVAPSSIPAQAPCHVTISAGEFVSLLKEAVQANRTWLRDFEQDDITLTSDLYQVLQAHRRMHRPSA